VLGGATGPVGAWASAADAPIAHTPAPAPKLPTSLRLVKPVVGATESS